MVHKLPMPRCAMTEPITLAMPRLASNDRGPAWQNRVLPQDAQLNLALPHFASSYWSQGPAPSFSFWPSPVNTIWPCLAVKAMTQHISVFFGSSTTRSTHSGHASPCNCNDWGPAPAFSFWPYLAVQVMTAGQHRLEGHASLCKQWLWARNDQGQHRPKPGKEKKSHNFKVGLFFCFPLYLLIFSWFAFGFEKKNRHIYAYNSKLCIWIRESYTRFIATSYIFTALNRGKSLSGRIEARAKNSKR